MPSSWIAKLSFGWGKATLEQVPFYFRKMEQYCHKVPGMIEYRREKTFVNIDTGVNFMSPERRRVSLEEFIKIDQQEERLEYIVVIYIFLHHHR